jgi:aspartate/methionine/tyrosine aminotransferase
MRIATQEARLFKQAIQALMSEHVPFISMGLGEPELETPELIKKAASRAIAEGYTKYSNPAGLPSLRRAIAEKLWKEDHIETDENRILVTPGGKNALFIACMGVLENGSETINFTPCYISNLPILHLVSRNIRVKNLALRIPDYRIDRDALAGSITNKTRAIIINFPHNPTGATLHREDAEFLVELVRERDLYIISDEVYDKFVFAGRHVAIGSYPEIRDKVVTIKSFSKSHFMTGWRIGYMNANDDLIKELIQINLHINTNTAAFIQMAALEALRVTEDIFTRYYEEVKRRREKLVEVFKQDQPGFKLQPAGLFTFLDISRKGLKSDEFCEQLLLEEKVAVMPGINFGKAYDDFCRISFATRTDLFEEGITRIKRFLYSR